jgi:ubiquinone/menaquinone biosynthesis C-methylase UbiE
MALQEKTGSLNSISREMKEERYIPAMGLRWLTPLYDPLTKFFGLAKVKEKLIANSKISEGQRVLDIGCGTGTLLQMIRQTEPNTELVGLDGDPKILQIAKEKTKNLNIRFDQAMAYELPYPDASYDRVLSSLVFHHLSTTNKQRAFREILRVLRPGGLMVIADFGPAQNRLRKFLTNLLKRIGHISDNLEGLLPVFAKNAGFAEVETVNHFNMILGTIWIFQGQKP